MPPIRSGGDDIGRCSIPASPPPRAAAKVLADASVLLSGPAAATLTDAGAAAFGDVAGDVTRGELLDEEDTLPARRAFSMPSPLFLRLPAARSPSPGGDFLLLASSSCP